jgi:hypothetical protein
MPSREDLLPSEVRARVLEEHAVLRARMEALARAGRAPNELRAEIEGLLEALRRVVAIEHDLLLPTLRTIDAWGQERARRLSAWHLDVRDRVEQMRRDLSERPNEQLATHAYAFVELLREDLGSEERLHLSGELLRELPIPADLGGD